MVLFGYLKNEPFKASLIIQFVANFKFGSLEVSNSGSSVFALIHNPCYVIFNYNDRYLHNPYRPSKKTFYCLSLHLSFNELILKVYKTIKLTELLLM